MSEINDSRNDGEEKRLRIIDTVVIRDDPNLGTFALSRWNNGIITQDQYNNAPNQPSGQHENPQVIWEKIKNINIKDLPDASEVLRLIDLYQSNPFNPFIPVDLRPFLLQVIRRVQFALIKNLQKQKGL